MTAKIPTPPDRFEIKVRGPIDPARSLAIFSRWGDDLLDRWDGRTLLRTLPIDGRNVAFAITFAGTARAPILSVTVEHASAAEIVEHAVARTFVNPPREFAALGRADPIVGRLDARYRGLRTVLQSNLLSALVRCISAQQVNLKWAALTRRRLAEHFGDSHSVAGETVTSLDANRLANATVAEIRALQFTNRKSEYIIAVAREMADDRLDLESLIAMSDDAVIERLVAIRGIGRWTAEWILARTMGRPRVVAGDLGVRKAVGIAYGGGAMPSEDDTRRLTAHWGGSSGHAQTMLLHALGEKELHQLARPD